MNITRDQLEMDLNSIGVQTRTGWLFFNNVYRDPDLEFIKGPFATAYNRNLITLGLTKYVNERNMCGNFSVFAWWQARTENSMTSQEENGVSLGCFLYNRTNVPEAYRGRHVIVFTDIGNEIAFWEPQRWANGDLYLAQLQLTDEEIGSNYGGMV